MNIHFIQRLCVRLTTYFQEDTKIFGISNPYGIIRKGDDEVCGEINTIGEENPSVQLMLTIG